MVTYHKVFEKKRKINERKQLKKQPNNEQTDKQTKKQNFGLIKSKTTSN